MKAGSTTSKVFEVYSLQDDVSFYYTNLGYPIISKLENKLRRIITVVLIKNFGKKWKKDGIPNAVKYKDTKNNFSNDVQSENSRFSLFELNFNQLSHILFFKYSKIATVQDLFNKIVNINPEKVLKKLEELKPKSNWDRYFTAVDDFHSLEKKWEKLNAYRIKIAHNKEFYSNELKDLKTLDSEILKILTDAEAIIDDIVIPQREKRRISQLFLPAKDVSDYYIIDTYTTLTAPPSKSRPK